MQDVEADAFIHPSAEVEEGAMVGGGTRIWARTHVRRGSRLGRDCNIGESVLIDVDVRVGDRCKVQSHALLFHATLGDDVFIGPAACLTDDRFPRASTPDAVLKSTADWIATGVDVGRGASVGACAVVVAGYRIGEWAMVGSGSVVTRDVPAHALVVGNPARRIGWVCVCGLRLTDDLACTSCGRRYIGPDADHGGLRLSAR